MSWTREEVDDRLHKIMIAIHKNCYETAEMYGTPGNLVNGANISGFLNRQRHAEPGPGVARCKLVGLLRRSPQGAAFLWV